MPNYNQPGREKVIFEERIFIEASPQDIYSLYADVENWNQWDKEEVYSHLLGAFEIGVKGILKPTNGPKAKIAVTDATPNKTLLLRANYHSAFYHLSTSCRLKENTEVTHKVKFSGLTSFLFGKVVGKKIYDGPPSTLEGLEKAENNV